VTVPIQFALLGLGAGALYGLAALGLVLVYRGSGVINFAQGAVGMIGTFAFYELHDNYHTGFLLAFVPSVLLCAVLGVAIQLLVMRPLRNSSGLVRLLATLGVLTTLQGAASLRYTQQLLVVAPSLPQSPVKIFGAAIGEDRLIILGIVLALMAALGFVYKYTRFGLATAAVAENSRSAAHLGYSPNFIAGANWALGSMLAGTAGILLSPITGLQVTSLTLLVIPALAAAVAGKMVSFPITVGAGLLIGIAQSELARYVSNPGWSAAVPFFVIIVVLSLRGTALPTRGMTSLKLPSVGTGRIRPWLLALTAVVGFLIILTVSPNWVDGITTTVVVGVVVLSVVVVTGYAGQVSLAQWALAGFGAWVAARLVATHGLSFLVALLIAMLVMIPVGAIVGLPAVRSRGDQLAIVTLGVAVALEQLIFDSPSLTGGDVGTVIGTPNIFGFDIDTALHPRSFAVVAFVFFLLAALIVANLRRGRAGLRLLALRANERAAASLGVSVAGAKLYAFSLAAVIASVGGVLYAFRNPSVVFSDFAAFTSVTVVGYGVIGGLGYTAGPLVGSTLQPGGIATNIGDLFGAGIQSYLAVAGGVILILTLILNPDGIVASEVRRFARLRQRFLAKVRPAKADKAASADLLSRIEVVDRRVADKALAVRNLSVRFGATQVLKDVSLDVTPGHVLGLIGPNGAGKTTVIDAVTGFVRPAGGTIELGGVNITKTPAHRRARAGVARSYQSLELFDDLTVLENLLVAAEPCPWWRYLTDLFWPGRTQIGAATRRAIETFGLTDALQMRPTGLPYGQRRLVAIARAVAAEPSVLLLDEPAAGLGEVEREELRTVIRRLAGEHGIAVLLIEHDVALVMDVCDRIVALDVGQIIAEGSPESVRTDPGVIAAYLGAPEEPGAEPAANSPDVGLPVKNATARGRSS
jgi:ABC-type branched-subunit amino acid transport system ATPase component/branched-subunit amino acid ABC-type transport system permease component